MTIDFAKSILAIPTTSGNEDWMVETIEQWAKDHGVECRRDSKKNLYLTKGRAAFFPCVTSHMDTVHRDQQEYIDRHELLPIEEKGDKLYIPHGPDGKQTGVGADCKAGIAICLSIVEAQPNIKACFFVEEEVGMQGSEHLDKEWFNDVAYVIGFDSPEQNRAAKACSGTLLFDDAFFRDNIEAVASQHGVTNFKYEPYTDVLNIRKKTQIACMNFGNGGWHPHQKSEYVMFSQMCKAEELGNALVNTIPLDKQYKIPVNARPDWGFSSYSPYGFSSASTTSSSRWAYPSSSFRPRYDYSALQRRSQPISDYHSSPYSTGHWGQSSQAQAQSPGRMSLAQYAAMKGQEKLRREGLLGRDIEDVEPTSIDENPNASRAADVQGRPGEYRPNDFHDDFEDSWDIDEPTDAELDAIEDGPTEQIVDSRFDNDDEIEDFFNWLNSRK